MAEPRYTTERFSKPCACREAGCLCNVSAERQAAEAMIDEFARAIKRKFIQARTVKGRTGWDERDWSAACIEQMKAHCDKGDPVDVALFAAFLWNMSAP